ncbi:asparagine--tRNA ligase [Pseudomonadota bacterium]
MKKSPYILLNLADQNINKSVTIRGWISNIRSSGKIAFLQIRDGIGVIQAVVVKSEVKPQVYDHIRSLTLESSIELTGTIKQEPRSPTGFDLQVTNLKPIHVAPDDYPIGKKEHGPAFLLDNRHLWLRSPKQRAIQIIRHHIIAAIFDFYKSHNFIKIDTPIITPNACEGTTTLFELDYFGTPTYLSQSGQLYLEAAIFSVGRCFDFSPVFRAEKSKTRRHLTEFWMTNAESSFVEHDQNLEIQENMIMFILKKVLKNCQEEFNTLNRDITPLEKIKAPFKRLTYHQVIKQLNKLGSDIKIGEDLGNDDESILMNHYTQPIFIEHWPANIKAFYMKRLPQDNSLALCADLLAPEGRGEIIGGSQREDDYDTLLASIKSHKLPQDEFGWYLDLRKYGSVPHSGFGLGLERLVGWIANLEHVRETTPFPRLLNRYKP